MVFGSRSEATEYVLADNDTLALVAARANLSPPLTPQELAIFNWGTVEPRALNRVLFEAAGFRELDGQDPLNNSRFVRSKVNGTFKLLIPKHFEQSNLETKKTYQLTVRKPPTFVAIGISELDKWFLPGDPARGGEACTIRYAVEGEKAHADQVDLSVYASQYCNAAAAANGTITYQAPLVDVPIYEKAAQEADVDASAAAAREVNDWYGQSNAADGLLKPRNPGETHSRHINVAFSPYTVQLRFRKSAPSQDTDKTARIDLEPFWPLFDAADQPVGASLTIGWKIKHCDRFKYGTLLILDAQDNVVHRQALAQPEGMPADVRQTYDWNGDITEGPNAGTRAAPASMPYRAQIQLHTDWNEAEGLALTVMHTEVRMFVHPQTGRHKRTAAPPPRPRPLAAGEPPPKPDPHEDQRMPWFDPNTLEFGIAPYVTAPPPQTDLEDWARYRLALGGFHPGPVRGVVSQTTFHAALHEFTRSHPKPRLGGPGFQRLRDDLTIDADVEAELGALAECTRPLFGKESGSDVLDMKTQAASEKALVNHSLNDPADELVVWVDDRHMYTESLHGHHNDARYNAPLNNNYRGRNSAGDAIVNLNATQIARPSLPVEVAIPLLRKGDALTADNLKLSTLSADAQETMRRAVGPLRVSWTFDEIGEDFYLVDNTLYNKRTTRTRAWLVETINRLAIVNGLAGVDARRYTNCPDKYQHHTLGALSDCGGIRPRLRAFLPLYYKRAFGDTYDWKTGANAPVTKFDLLSLEPWTSIDDPAHSAVCTVVHDDVGQPPAEVHADYVGKAGTYLHPSRIGGDGYRFRAQVTFEDVPGEALAFPNKAALAARYPELPQAYTSRLRNWKKSSLRGRVKWIADDLDTNGVQAIQSLIYNRAAYLHLVQEDGGLLAAGLPTYVAVGAVNALLTPQEYRTLIRDCVNTLPSFPAMPVTFNPRYIWPYTSLPHQGLAESRVNQPYSDYVNKKLALAQGVFARISEPLILRLIQRVEEKYGKLRGHLIVEFSPMPRLKRVTYKCKYSARRQPTIKIFFSGTDFCGDEVHQLIAEGEDLRDTANTPHDRNCPKPNCLGAYRAHAEGDWRHCHFMAVGLSGGAAYVYCIPHGTGATWAHELSHNRHLEHSYGLPGAAQADPPAVRPLQHDSEPNPNFTGVGAIPDGNHNGTIYPNHPNDKNWDRCCIMSYVNSNLPQALWEGQYFCGKCILKLRGWAVEGLSHVAGNIQDP